MVVKCPYCNEELEKPPKRKAKCPHCSKTIFVRKNNPFSKSTYITEEQAKGIDKFYTLKYFALDAGITNKQFEKEYVKNMNEQYNADLHDYIWSRFNESLHKKVNAKRPEWWDVSFLYHRMAEFFQLDDKDPLHLLKESKRAELYNYIAEGNVKKVKIVNSSDYSCEECKKLNGKVMSLKDALKNMPLPCEGCTNIPDKRNKPFCNCRYDPVY